MALVWLVCLNAKIYIYIYNNWKGKVIADMPEERKIVTGQKKG